MAKTAGNPDPVWSDELLRQIIVGVVVIAFSVPLARRGFVEVGVGEKAQSDDPARVPVIRSGRDVLAARANGDARVFLGILKRIGRAVHAPHVEPQPITP